MWYARLAGTQVGPVEESDALAWAASGRLTAGDLVWSDGMPQWLPAGQVTPFAQALASAQPAAGEALGDNAWMRLVLPVGRSFWAILSGYMGLFSVLLLPAPFALITGIVAIWDIRTHPSKHGLGRATFGIIMGLLGTLVLVWIFINQGD